MDGREGTERGGKGREGGGPGAALTRGGKQPALKGNTLSKHDAAGSMLEGGGSGGADSMLEGGSAPPSALGTSA